MFQNFQNTIFWSTRIAEGKLNLHNGRFWWRSGQFGAIWWGNPPPSPWAHLLFAQRRNLCPVSLHCPVHRCIAVEEEQCSCFCLWPQGVVSQCGVTTVCHHLTHSPFFFLNHSPKVSSKLWQISIFTMIMATISETPVVSYFSSYEVHSIFLALVFICSSQAAKNQSDGCERFALLFYFHCSPPSVPTPPPPNVLPFVLPGRMPPPCPVKEPI